VGVCTITTTTRTSRDLGNVRSQARMSSDHSASQIPLVLPPSPLSVSTVTTQVRSLKVRCIHSSRPQVLNLCASIPLPRLPMQSPRTAIITRPTTSIPLESPTKARPLRCHDSRRHQLSCLLYITATYYKTSPLAAPNTL
jgi:hypothetical protein